MIPHKYLFVLSPPFSGSTLLTEILGTSSNVSIFTTLNHEGQNIPELKKILLPNRWEPNRISWKYVKTVFEKNWNMAKPILVEKSPPNLLHAKYIEKYFPSPFFITLIRNPYAWCVGYKQRFPEKSYDSIANIWGLMAYYQKQNQNLKKILHLSYEKLCDNPKESSTKIISFIPDIVDLHFDKQFRLISFDGYKQRPITNLNKRSIELLSENEIKLISDELRKNTDVMDFFNYEILK